MNKFVFQNIDGLNILKVSGKVSIKAKHCEEITVTFFNKNLNDISIKELNGMLNISGQLAVDDNIPFVTKDFIKRYHVVIFGQSKLKGFQGTFGTQPELDMEIEIPLAKAIKMNLSER